MTRSRRDYWTHLASIVGENGWVSRGQDEWIVSCKVCRSKRKRTVFRSEKVAPVAALWQAHEATAEHVLNVDVAGGCAK